MKFNIYDDKNEPFEIDTGDKEILNLHISVFDDNEELTIYYKNKFRVTYELENHNNYLGEYIVLPEDIDEWKETIKLIKKEESIAYERSIWGKATWDL
ncbi:MAG: hypothetical protein HXM14_02925 [Fusobacterium periodonticum]|jgi:hypothetical protein|nr:hypothetical protein [Fusobacterium periodonticum]